MFSNRLTKFIRSSLVAFAATQVALCANAFGKDKKEQPFIEDPTVRREFVNKPDDVPARTIRVKIGRVEEADRYEAEVTAVNGSWAQPFKLITRDDSFRFRVSPGSYMVRTRTIDTTRRISKWGDWQKFEVPLRIPKEVFPQNGAKIDPKGETIERLKFEWPEIEGASAYRVKVYDSNKKLIKHIMSVQNWATVPLHINAKYSWTLQALRYPHDPDDPKRPEYKFTIIGPYPELFPIEIKLQAKAFAVKYQFELITINENETTSDPTIYESIEPLFTAKLSPAEYELRVRSVFSDGKFSQWSAPRSFFIRLPLPVPVYPGGGVLVESNRIDESKIKFRWTKVLRADRYRVTLTRGNGEQFNIETKEHEPVLPIPNNDSYKWSVVALLKRETDRRPASVEATKEESFSINTYIPLKLGESEEPSQLFMWGKGIAAGTDYTAENYDNHSLINQPVFSTAFEGALGYWHRKTNYGVLGTATVSGIDIAGLQQMSYGVSLLGGYRLNNLGGNRRARVWFGPAYRETPEVLVNGATNRVEIERISNVGPQILVAFFDTFSKKWGYQVFAGGYYGLLPIKTPNGLPQQQYLTYHGSLYATYKLTQNFQALAGYTYQLDEAGYKSDDRTMFPNHVRYAGHYLSLAFVWGLQEREE